MNPIEEVVMPLKVQAEKRAEQFARKIVEDVRIELEAAGNDREKVAPYPKCYGPNALCGDDYHDAKRKYNLYAMFTRGRACGRRPSDPDFADIVPELVESFVKMAVLNAAAQYDAFVAKLVKKVGPVETAKLDGDHVWGFSILTVSKVDGTIEHWKTQMIINVSKLGLMFNQWPTRQVKAGSK